MFFIFIPLLIFIFVIGFLYFTMPHWFTIGSKVVNHTQISPTERGDDDGTKETGGAQGTVPSADKKEGAKRNA